ncbi:MAG: ABC transporter permease, partial [Betaproteobacteria bacterium]
MGSITPREISAARRAAPLRVLGRLVREQPLGALGALVLAAMTVIAIGAPYFAPFDPSQGSSATLSSPPNAVNWLGTDAFGRDNMSRLIYGARISLMVGIGASVLGVGVGATLGILTAYRGGWADIVAQRVMDALLAFPMLLLAL